MCFILVIVKASSGPRYVVGYRNKLDKETLTSGTRVVLDMTTLTIMRALPREVCFLFPLVSSMKTLMERLECLMVEISLEGSNWFDETLPRYFFINA